MHAQFLRFRSMQSSVNSEEDVQSAIDNGTFFTTLMAETTISVIPAPGQPGKTQLSFAFPAWFDLYIDLESQQLIIQKIRNSVMENLDQI